MGMGVDVWEMLDPVDVMGQLPRDWEGQVLKQAKWSDKKEWIEKLIHVPNALTLHPCTAHPHTRSAPLRVLSVLYVSVWVLCVWVGGCGVIDSCVSAARV